MNWYMKTWTKRLIVGGRRMRYTGSSPDVFGRWIKLVLLSAVTLTLYWWLRGRGAMQTYMDTHLEWAD